MQLLYQGAEAVISKDENIVVKNRIKKSYRAEQIDTNLRTRRTRSEARLLREARRAGVMTPQILEEEDFTIKMEFIDGEKVKDILDRNNFREIAKNIGACIAKLHGYNIIHGDLTTSNMILVEGKVYFIDFGLGFFSQRIEDKATDMHLLKEVLVSTHFEIADDAWGLILGSYKSDYDQSDKVIKALSKIEKRGRYVER